MADINPKLKREILKIRVQIDKETKSYLKKLLKEKKISQDNLILLIKGIIASGTGADGNYVVDLNRLRKVITDSFNELNDTEAKIVTECLTNAYNNSFTRISDTIGMNVSFKLRRKEFITAALLAPIDGKRYSQRIWSNTNELANRIYKDVLSAINDGKSVEKIARKIKKDYGVSAYQAKRLINTEVARVQSAAALDVYRAGGVVKEIMWSATLEQNTCEICADLDGKRFSLDNAPVQPAHPNCRCAYIPVIDGWTPKKRVVNNGTADDIIDYIDFNNWGG